MQLQVVSDNRGVGEKRATKGYIPLFAIIARISSLAVIFSYIYAKKIIETSDAMSGNQEDDGWIRDARFVNQSRWSGRMECKLMSIRYLLSVIDELEEKNRRWFQLEKAQRWISCEKRFSEVEDAISEAYVFIREYEPQCW